MGRFPAFLFCFYLAAALAQGTIEVIPLRHRTAEQVIPILQPLVVPGGALSGQYNQLIVRTTAENLEQIRQVLASIDRPQRRLMVSVRFDTAMDAARFGVDGSARISGRDVGANVRIEDTRSTGNESIAQQVQVLEGGEARISTGEMRFWNDASTGMVVVPRLAGSNVTLDLYAQQERFVRGGAIQGQRAATVVSGRLGEWIELGGTSISSVSSGTGTLSTRDSVRNADRRMWLRVEELR